MTATKIMHKTKNVYEICYDRRIREDEHYFFNEEHINVNEYRRRQAYKTTWQEFVLSWLIDIGETL